eukprot:6409111-Prymnesium_polylepis.2
MTTEPVGVAVLPRHDFSNVDLYKRHQLLELQPYPLAPQTFSSALKTFRLAALRYGMQHRIIYRRFTNLVQYRRRLRRLARKRFASVSEPFRSIP